MAEQPPYSIPQVLANLGLIAQQMEQEPPDKAWVIWVCQDIRQRGVALPGTEEDIRTAALEVMKSLDKAEQELRRILVFLGYATPTFPGEWREAK